MSEGDVSLIRDEDVLRRMWQQTEDFSRKKEIRAHMYRLREERLRNLYASQTHHSKGVEEVGSHVSSLLDQSFQGLKSKEVRDAASPPKLFDADLKELSNAGWNVESEKRTTDDGHTHVRSMQANIEGRYDVEGGAGQFAAIDQQQQAATEYKDDNTSLKRNQSSATSAAQEQVFRKTDNGTEFSSTKTSSSSSQFHEESSTRHEVPYPNNDYDIARNTNITNEKRNVSNTSSYEQNLRKSDFESGELISRKVDYPDDNTKVIVETRCLPDGTRVTSTRREFRVPTQTTKSEQRSQTKSETKSYSTTSQQRPDINSHRNVNDDRIDIVDSQRYADDYDFKRNEINYLNEKNEFQESHQTLRKETNNVNKKESSSTITHKTIENEDVVDHKIFNHKNVENYEKNSDRLTEHANKISDHFTTEKYLDQCHNKKVDEVDRREDITKIHNVRSEVNDKTSQRSHNYETRADSTNIKVKKIDDLKVTEKELKETQRTNVNDSVIRDVNKRDKVDEVVEKITKSDQYQTTYQSDYTQKKISNDWSPSHQAWASTLRADTPSSTHPTTRGSSPGSKTYQSSTSSLRSSVSPDKTYRKPSSRGGSPIKSDRYPHTYSDRLSSTHSTTSSIHNTRYTSPDRKPPQSPVRDFASPNKKQPDQREKSPEKRSQAHHYSPSPERKPEYSVPYDQPKQQSPSRDHFRASPEKYVPKTNFNRKSSEKNPGVTSTSQPNRCSMSPDRKPGYMRSTESQTNRDAKHLPETKPSSKIVNVEQDHYKFIDEETKMYSRTDRNDYDYSKKYSPSPVRNSKSPSPIRYTPDYDSDCRSESPIRPTLRKTERSPSPPKGPVTFKQDTKESTVKDTTTLDNHLTEETIKRPLSPNRGDSPIITNSREQSPSKYGTYDIKKRSSVERNVDIRQSRKYDSTNDREETSKITPISPSKHDKDKVSPVRPSNSRESSPSFGTYDRKSSTDEQLSSRTTKSSHKDSKYDSLTHHKKTSKDVTDTTFNRCSPRSSVSPVKSPAKESKYKHSTDFISTEKTTEETYKNIKSHPRQLITPSSSPTRKPKVDETEPSTGHSSPTTSVSGFVYYGSPKSQEMVTDLDDVEYHSTALTTEEITTNNRPQTLPVDKRSSPSRIPCRSPSPDKATNKNNENLVRKSSLKKTSTVYSPASPTEKPPTSFRVSPEKESYEFPEHKVVKKDNPENPKDSPVKPKPPFERRETYEERCRKILGMTDDTNSKTVKRTSSFKETKTKDNIKNLPSEPKENPDTIKTDITDSITREEKINTVVYNKTPVNRKSSSRESSPTKLQDIINRDVSPDNEQQKVQKGSTPRKSVSPDKNSGYMKSTFSTKSKLETTSTSENHQRNLVSKTEQKSPDRDIGYKEPTRSNTSQILTSQYETSDKEHFEKSPRSSVSPSRKPEYIKSTKTSSIKTETIGSKNIDVDVSKNLVCDSIDNEIGYSVPSDRSPERKPVRGSSPVSKPAHKTLPRSSISPDKSPSYMKPTVATQFKHDEQVVNSTTHTTTTSKVLAQAKSDTNETYKKSKESRLPSPTKVPSDVKGDTTSFIQSEREQEILDKVQKSLRKLSPDRNHRSPSREKSPGKTTISLHDLEITKEDVTSEQKLTEKDSTETVSKTKTSKILTRNVSPTKNPQTPTVDKSSDSPTTKIMQTNKPRSISPKKPASPTERPPSPQVSKPSGVKLRDQTTSQPKKYSSGNTSPTKIEKVLTETKKTTQVTKQNSFTKTQNIKTTLHSPTRKTESEPKRAPTPKSSFNENVTIKKEDNKVTRTASDASLKPKKSSPQRVKPKPEIQVSDLTSTNTNKRTTTINKSPQRSTKPKPKSATSLNISVDEDDVLIDVEQAKSSRENSPDRICPTPVNLTDDVQTPRYPDEVKEPDDEFRKRAYHTIHETETIVDDIVEIDEEDELFTKKTDINRFTESDECLLSVTDKVSKFTNKIETVTKPKESTIQFKDTERKVHSDFIDENLKSDECLLTVTEKVNKFTKGDAADSRSRSPSYQTTDVYDVEPGYPDDYTKLSVSDKAHLFIETAENSKTTKTKPVQKIQRPNLDEVDENLKSDECMLSVSDKVNKFVKTAEQFLNESSIVEDKKVKEEYEKFMKNIVDGKDDNICEITKEDHETTDETVEKKAPSYSKDTTSSQSKIKDFPSSNIKQTEKMPTVKITTLRNSEAVKKAKALFENIATTQQTKDTKTTKLTDIGVLKKSPKPHSNGDIHVSKHFDVDSETDSLLTPVTKEKPSSGALTKPHQTNHVSAKSRDSPTRLPTNSPEVPRCKSPVRPNDGTTVLTKSVLSRYPAAQKSSIEKQKTPETLVKHATDDKPQEQVPGYMRSTNSSHAKEEIPLETVEETEIISTRRGSGKFGVELRRTSVEKTTVNNERRRSSTEHHQPCIEDIFDLGLLEQMLEKVVGYEQRRRIRAQIRVVKKKIETERTEIYHTSKSTKYNTITHNKPSESRPRTTSPDRQAKMTPRKTVSPERPKQTQHIQSQEQQIKTHLNGHVKEPNNLTEKRQRTGSPEKRAQTSRQSSPEKKTKTATQSLPKPKRNKFNEYATAYMKKVGLNDTEKTKISDIRTKQSVVNDHNKETTKNTEFETGSKVNKYEEKIETKSTSTSKSIRERTSSKDTIEVVRINGKRSVSPEKKHSPERHTPGERLAQRSPSPDFKRTKTTDTRETTSRTTHEPESPRIVKKETIIKTVVEEKPVVESKKTSVKTVYGIEKKVQPKPTQEENPTWVINRNLKKTSSDSRTYNSKKIENEKTKYRASSPSKAITKPIDVITSSYGPGPLDADGRPLFGIKALKKGASNYQVKGTVIRQEFHSRNGSEPEGSVSVTAYSTEPEDLEKLLRVQGDRPSRLHGLAAITTTKKFGGDSGVTYKDVCSKEDRSSLEQFSNSDRKISDSRIESVADSVVDKTEMRTIESLSDRREQRTLEKTSSVRSDLKNGVEKRENGVKTGNQGREERTTVRQSSVKNLTEKYIKSATGEKNLDRNTYPKAGLILRTVAKRDSVSSDSSAHAGLHRSDSAYSLGSEGEMVTSTTTQRTADGAVVTTSTTQRSTDGAVVTSTTTCSSTRRGDRSFLDSSSKVTGVQDILTRMKNADIVIQEGDTNEDSEARALLNKFLGATVLMAGMQNYVTEGQGGKLHVKETVRSSESRTTSRVDDFDPEQCWDERVLRKRLEESSDYEERRRLRTRIRALMAEQEACASAVSAALGAADDADDNGAPRPREEEEVTVSSSVRRDSSEKTVSSSTTTKTSKVIESMTRPAPKPVSPFAKFRQLEKQNSTNSPPNSAKTPQSPGSGAPFFKFTDPALQASAATIKERLLQWCRDKTRDYENVKLENFSTSWADGLAFCALVHHFLPDAFDYSQLSPERRRHNFTLAFKVADEKAGIYPLLDVDDMVAMKKPDWKCVFTYVQAIHRRFKDQS